MTNLENCNAGIKCRAEYLENEGPMKTNIERVDLCISLRWQQPERIAAFCTMQVTDYSRYEFSDEWTAEHIVWRDAHWKEDKKKTFDAGVNMAKKIMDNLANLYKYGFQE